MVPPTSLFLHSGARVPFVLRARQIRAIGDSLRFLSASLAGRGPVPLAAALDGWEAALDAGGLDALNKGGGARRRTPRAGV